MQNSQSGYNMKRLKILILGCDGYIGFPLTMRCLNNGHVVHGVDNQSRRKYVEMLGSDSATNITRVMDRVSDLSAIGDYTYHGYDILIDRFHIEKLMQRYQFDVIVNLAHNPSAPFSMRDRSSASTILSNNILITNNILWAIKEFSPNTHYITIGSTGEYDHTINVDIEEGYFNFEHNGRLSKKCLFPRQGNSIYHCSKIASTYLIDYLTRIWNLKCTDVMQSIVYGLYTDETESYRQVNRCDSDECFGTVLNRFVIQSLLNEPITVFGDGLHQRPFLALNDSIQALEIAINNEAIPGTVQTWNQLSEWRSVRDVAEMVLSIIPNSKITNIESPRKEFTGSHYYKFSTDTLTNLGYKPTRNMEQEIKYMLSVIKMSDTKKEILRSVIKPKILF